MTGNARSSNRWVGSACARLWWFSVTFRMIRGCLVVVTRPDAFDFVVWIKSETLSVDTSHKRCISYRFAWMLP
jgi:hypothetical protein